MENRREAPLGALPRGGVRLQPARDFSPGECGDLRARRVEKNVRRRHPAERTHAMTGAEVVVEALMTPVTKWNAGC
jgi:hypothetical protein